MSHIPQRYEFTLYYPTFDRLFYTGTLVDQVNHGCRCVSTAAFPSLPIATAVEPSFSSLSSAPPLSRTKKRARISTLEEFLGKSCFSELQVELNELGVEEIDHLKYLNKQKLI